MQYNISMSHCDYFVGACSSLQLYTCINAPYLLLIIFSTCTSSMWSNQSYSTVALMFTF